MGTEEEKIDRMFEEELAKSMNINKIMRFPATLCVVPDDVPELQRWRENE